jgi:hypothetical protein
MSAPRAAGGFGDEHRARFFAFLDQLPAKDRPVYGFSAQRSSLTQRLGGGAAYVVVLFFPDHALFSTRRMANDRETRRTTRLLGEISAIEVTGDPLRSTAVVRLVGDKPMKLTNIPPPVAAPLAWFRDKGLAAFDRSTLPRDAVRAFFVACSRALPLPDGLFKDP